MTFDEMLTHCSDPASSRYELAWTEFIRRYEKLIYNVALKRINEWNHPNARRNKQQMADDIYSTVLETFYGRGGRVLKNFQARDNEKKFVSFISTTTRRAAGRYLTKQLPASIVGTSVEDIITFIADSSDSELRWSLYESVVNEVRDQAKTKRGNLERDINIFLLYVWAGFDQQMIDKCPHLNGLGHRVVDLVVHRLRGTLRNSWQGKEGEE